MQPQWIVWENVPGVLSSAGGRDFGTFLGALAELGYGFAYRVLDAQWFGVAQRRRRVFVVAHAGDWRRAAAVLFERESVFGNSPTRGKAGQGVAGCVTARFGRNGGSANDDIDGNRIVAFHHNAQAAQLPHAGRDTSVTDSLTCSQGAAVAFTGDKTHALAARADSSEDGTGRGTPIVATPFTKSKRAQSTTDDETWVPGEVSPTMSCFNQGDTRATTVVAQGFTYSGYSNQPAWMTGDRTDCLPASGHSDGSHQGVGVAVAVDGRNQSASNDIHHTLRTDRDAGDCVASCEVSSTLRSNPGSGWRSNGTPVEGVVITPMAVRRLTPRECERLQGFPDDYTLVTYRNKPAADGPRYRALGNSMAVPVMAWIGKRIQMVKEATDGTQAR
jgi:DNA (cytosine-5)-methyltransferase 1